MNSFNMKEICKLGDYEMFSEHEIDKMFMYQSPTEGQVPRYQIIREKARELAHVIRENTNPSADQASAIRKLRECVMTANSSIALED